ncbi:MAG: dTMP kinase [Candidatus Omnitrophica bacterium]|nr:dTMP kinase [Candidatus Omnitrophota bacterium]
MRGLFITLEGPEGAGKSTQGKKLASWLKGKGHKVLFTREPGGTRTGQRLRAILLDHRSKDIDPFTELCLYEASRAVLVRQVIRPALRKGKIVIVDRFQDSTWVYQGWAGGIDLKLVETMGKGAMAGLKPDLTLLLDLPVKKGLARVTKPNRMEAKPLAFHRKVRAGYLKLAVQEPRRFQRIQADRPAAEVQQKIREIIKGVLQRRRRA